jgi:hypothetical protein
MPRPSQVLSLMATGKESLESHLKRQLTLLEACKTLFAYMPALQTHCSSMANLIRILLCEKSSLLSG